MKQFFQESFMDIEMKINLIKNIISDINRLSYIIPYVGDDLIYNRDRINKIRDKGNLVLDLCFKDESVDFLNNFKNFALIINTPIIDRRSNYYEKESAFNIDKVNLKLYFENILKYLISSNLHYAPNADQIFISHTQKDKNFCDDFDRIVARVGIKAFRSEFEKIPTPSWKTIKEEMGRSTALFFLVGDELASSQESNSPNWRYTQNWIAYEIGLACQLGIDVWAICSKNVTINFPMPFISHYCIADLEDRTYFELIKKVLEAYKVKDANIDKMINKPLVKCSEESCGIEFYFCNELKFGMPQVICPHCLKPLFRRIPGKTVN
jgi:hypothetical protein